MGNPINIYQAQYGVGGGFAPNEQTITFVGVPVVQPGTYPGAGSRVYRIKNIRVQVANSFQVNGQIQAFISIQNPPANLVLNNAQGVVGFVQRGLFFDVIAGGPYAQCLGWNSGSYPSSTQNAATGALRFTEAYGVAFKRRGFASSTLDVQEPVYNQFYRNGFGQSDPRVNYSNESGFYNIQLGGSGNKNNLNDAGIASQGTRLRARFSGVPGRSASMFLRNRRRLRSAARRLGRIRSMLEPLRFASVRALQQATPLLPSVASMRTELLLDLRQIRIMAFPWAVML